MDRECPLCRLFLLALKETTGCDYAEVGEVLWEALDYWFSEIGYPDYAQAHVRAAYRSALMGKANPGCEDLKSRPRTIRPIRFIPEQGEKYSRWSE